jgi:hypothetical protein
MNLDKLTMTRAAQNVSKTLKLACLIAIFRTHLKRTDKGAGPSGFEPETAGFLSMIVKSPVLYLAELRALR